MGGFRRFVLFVFSLAALVATGVPLLAMSPRAELAATIGALTEYRWTLLVYAVCLAMTCAWAVVNLLRALFSRKKRAAIEVMDIDGGIITVTRKAVASQAGHIVEALGVGTAKDVDVRASKSGPVHVTVRVTPYESIDITSEAPKLHEGLVRGLTAMCGERLGAIDVEFLEPQDPGSLVEPDEDGELAVSATSGEEVDAHENDGSEYEAGKAPASRQQPDPDSTGDITIRMTSERGE